ncbi:NAD-dependent DNA ligase LigA [Barnesiella sp. WM24]|uniref:NAD-dependent DNA ligase LigA n=1 Tax=Barnesiella sp. WM24 TaxID=2558278 RepID=UPI0010724578|nr:NAD-dependent DNA ligase LigA [Barnesiella sp. WM24]TFU92800.1 NAD-dependent DNA ligase LigA [Barnesiella sp. WM24]
MDLQPKQQIERLRDELNRHNYNYYVLNSPEISDRDFDMMMKELEQLEKEHPEYADPLSPTQRVGSDINKAFTQHLHQRPMLSLGNTYSIEEVDEFVTRTRDALMGQDFTIVGEMKYDGTSISLTYEHGRLVRAVTRGDGERGDVVTDNVKTIKSVPLTLQGSGWPEEFEIRGEIVLPWKEFDRLNAEREFNEEPLFANPRNAASGTLKMQNSAEVARRGLDAVFYYLLGDNLPADNHYDNMIAAKEWGFKVAPVMSKLHGIDEVDRFINHWDTARKELPVATDGLVFKVNDLRQQLNLGYTAKSPRWAIAYKFQAERALTRLQSVSFEVGRMGIVTPVANLDPVLLSGTIVKRASLHNEGIIRSLDIHDHDMLYVEKGGEIIPKVTGIDVSARQPDANPIQFVTRCPVCDTPLVRIEGEAAWMCPDKEGCAPQICGRLEHFVGRRMMNIEGIGEEMAVILYRNGWVKTPADLYTLSRHSRDMMLLPGMGPRTVERILDGIEASKSVPFERVVYALSIPYVGETVAKKLARAVRDIDSLMNADTESLTLIDDIGPRIAESIITYFSNPDNREMVEQLRAAGVQMSLPEEDESSRTDLLKGKSIVISGTFSHHSRDEYKEIIERNGGKNVSGISKKTDFVFAGENMGPSKLEKARTLGIPIINEEEFLKMINQ